MAATAQAVERLLGYSKVGIEMVFGGLHKIYFYGGNGTGETFVESLRHRYANLPSPPTMERVMCS